MKTQYLTLVFSILLLTGGVFGQTSWLDRPLNNWNKANGVVPNAPRTLAPIDERCRDQIRNPESLSDRAVTRAGWMLFGPSQSYGLTTVINGLASTDGMCRPTQYNTFVFVNNRFAGTLSPTSMDSRTDGALSEARLTSATAISAEFTRYTSNDALCCPSQVSTVTYNLTTGVAGIVKAANVETNATCQNQEEGGIHTQDNVISGTATYRQRIALPPTAVLTVRLVDVSRQDVSSTTIAELRIETRGKQVPFSFDLVFDWGKIQERNRYAVQAEIRDGGRLLFTTDTSYPVLSQGNPRNVDIVLVQVGGGDQPSDQGSGTLRGTVAYLQRIALPQNAMVSVKLLESTTPENDQGNVISQNNFNANGRQVPIQFEINYEPRKIDAQKTYFVTGEISADGKKLFVTKTPVNVITRGNPTSDIRLMLVQGTEAITGKSLSLSKFGTGSIRIGDQSSRFLIRGSVNVDTNGDTNVTVSAIDGSTAFAGKLTYFDDTTLRITVESSGNADASGEIEVKYAGRRINSIKGNNLVLDGQNVTLNF